MYQLTQQVALTIYTKYTHGHRSVAQLHFCKITSYEFFIGPEYVSNFSLYFVAAVVYVFNFINSYVCTLLFRSFVSIEKFKKC